MKRSYTAIAFVAVMLLAGCHKAAVVAPVPGSINSLDAWAFRVVSDSSAAIHSVKTWEQCTELSFPATVNVDGNSEVCDAKAGSFPMQFKGDLNLAITSLNTASAAGKLYHSGASSDAVGLTQAVNQLSNAVTTLVSQIGGK